MASTNSRGNYYKRKSKDHYKSLGYVVQLTEFVTSRPIGGGKMVYVKKDVFGSDGIAMNGKEIIFWNSKSTIAGDEQISWHKTTGKKEFAKYPFPKSVKKQLIIWQPRKKPIIVDL